MSTILHSTFMPLGEDLENWPKIFHISGPSGSGKTTLGRKIAERYKQSETHVKVIETDLYLQPSHEDAAKLFKLDRDSIAYHDRWIEHMTNKFMKDIIDANEDDVLVFIGLLDQMGPVLSETQSKHAPAFAHMDYSNYPIFFPCEKFFLTIPLDIFIQRWRTTRESLSSSFDLPAEEEIIKHYHHCSEWYLREGYEPLSEDEIMSKIHECVSLSKGNISLSQ